VVSLLNLFVASKDGGETQFLVNLDDDIIDAALLVHQGQFRKKGK
jgi:hypothetical protein